MMSSVEFRRHFDAAAFATRATPWSPSAMLRAVGVAAIHQQDAARLSLHESAGVVAPRVVRVQMTSPDQHELRTKKPPLRARTRGMSSRKSGGAIGCAGRGCEAVREAAAAASRGRCRADVAKRCEGRGACDRGARRTDPVAMPASSKPSGPIRRSARFVRRPASLPSGPSGSPGKPRRRPQLEADFPIVPLIRTALEHRRRELRDVADGIAVQGHVVVRSFQRRRREEE